MEESSAYILLSAAILLKIFVSAAYADRAKSVVSVIWFIISFLYECNVHIVYYSRVHKNSPEKLITILEDMGFPAERRLYVKATLISIDGEYISHSGRPKYICTIRRKRDGKIIRNVLLEDDRVKIGDKVKVSYFSSGLTSYPYTIIAR